MGQRPQKMGGNKKLENCEIPITLGALTTI